MALQFNPPDWLVQEYIRRKNPGLEIVDSLGQAANTYANIQQQKNQRDMQQQQMDMARQKLEMEKQNMAMQGREAFYQYGDPSGLPQGVQASMGQPVQGPMTPEGVAPQESPIISYFNEFRKQYPQGIKGHERENTPKYSQAPILINGKAARFNQAGQYEIAPVVDPTNPTSSGAPSVVQNPTFEPRAPQQPSSQIIGTQDGKVVFANPKTQEMTTKALPGSGPLTPTTQTEGQSGAKLYAARMEEADTQLNNLATSTDLTSISAEVQGALPNRAKSQKIQLFEQAKRNFLTAVLRRESGAAISPTEFAEGDKQYFPVGGDGPDVLLQKARNRQTAIAGLRNAAGMAPNAAPSGGGGSDPLGIR